MQLLKVIQNQLPRDGQVYQTASMPLLLIKMERLISSKDRNIGDTMEEISMVIILKRLVKVSLVFLITLMPLWCGVEMEKFISIRVVNSGDLIHSRDHQSNQLIQNLSVIGREFQTVLMQLFNTRMVTRTSLRVINIIDSMIEPFP